MILYDAYQTMNNARTFQNFPELMASINKCGKYYQQNNFSTEWPTVATTVTSGTQRHHWSIRISGVYLRIIDPDPSNPNIFLRLCSPSDCRQSIESPVSVQKFNSTEKAFIFTIYDYFWEYFKNVCYLRKSISTYIEKILL